MNDQVIDGELVELRSKLMAKGYQEFIQEMESCSPYDRQARMLSLANHRQQIISDQKANTKILKLTEELKVLKAPYNEEKAMNEKLARFIHLLSPKTKEE